MKTRHLSITLLAMAAIMVSCGKKQVPTDGIFGEVPSLVLSSAQDKEELEKELASAKNLEDAAALFQKSTAAQKMYKEKFEQTESTLKGKEIPTEIDKNIFLKFDKPFSIEKVSSKGVITLVGEGEFTAEGSVYSGKGMFNHLKLGIVFYNAEGTPFDASSLFYTQIDGTAQNEIYPKGTKITLKAHVRIMPWNVENMAAIKSITVTSVERDLYRNAIQTDIDAKDALKETQGKK